MNTKNFFMTIAFLGITGAANATVYNVNTEGDANTGTGTTGTLRYCIGQANADAGTPHTINVNLTPGTVINLISTAVQCGSSNYALSIKRQNVTLNGNGIILDGQNTRIILLINADNVTINKVTFRNGKENLGYCAAMGVVGTTSGVGNAYINNCTFYNNTITRNQGTEGIIIVENNKTYVTGCVFINNNVTSNGAVIMASHASSCVYVSACLFINCGNRMLKASRNGCFDSQGNNISDVSDANLNNSSDRQVGANDVITWNVGAPVASSVTASFSLLQKTLTIAGSGAMQDFASVAPWEAINTIMYIAVIRNSVTNIGNNAFKNCFNLRQVRLPNSDVTTIGANAFAGCSLLTHIFLTKDVPPSLDPTAFDGLTKSSIGVFVPTPDMYRANSSWQDFSIVDAYCTNCN